MQVALSDVTVRYGDRTVLDGVSAIFNPGEVTVVMGPSGSGKSTLFAAIAGAARITSGTIAPPLDEASVEWIVQTTPLLQRRRVIDNVELSMRLRGVPGEIALLRAARALKNVGILHHAREFTHRLSGGEKQRVAVARAMGVDSSVLLADEPTASLDATARDAVCDALRAAARTGAVVVVATHDIAVARQAHRVLELTAGNLRERLL